MRLTRKQTIVLMVVIAAIAVIAVIPRYLVFAENEQRPEIQCPRGSGCIGLLYLERVNVPVTSGKACFNDDGIKVHYELEHFPVDFTVSETDPKTDLALGNISAFHIMERIDAKHPYADHSPDAWQLAEWIGVKPNCPEE